MEIFWFSFNAIVPLMLLVALGIFLRKAGMIDDSLNTKVNRLLFQVAFPISLFSAIMDIEGSNSFSPKLIVFAIGSILAVLVVLMITVPRLVKDRRKCGALIQGIYRGNYLLLGYPLARNLFGSEGIGHTAMLMPLVIAAYNVMAVFVLEYYSGSDSRVNWSKMLVSVLKNPLIIGAAAGVVFNLLPWELPVFASRAVTDVAGIANPLALIMLGSQVSWARMTGRLRLVVSATLLRLLIIPAIIVSLAVAAGFRGSELGALYILFCSPTAIASYIMAKNMNSDSDLAAQIIVTTTAFSGLSLFLITYILRYLALI